MELNPYIQISRRDRHANAAICSYNQSLRASGEFLLNKNATRGDEIR